MTKGFQSSSAEKSRRRLYIHGRVYNTRRYSKRLLSDLVHVRLNNWSAIVFFTNEFYLESLVSCFNNALRNRGKKGEEERKREKENKKKRRKKEKRERRGNVFNERNKLKDENGQKGGDREEKRERMRKKGRRREGTSEGGRFDQRTEGRARTRDARGTCCP